MEPSRKSKLKLVAANFNGQPIAATDFGIFRGAFLFSPAPLVFLEN